MVFYCPKCGEYTKTSIERICPGTELACVGCGSIYSVSYDVVFDSDEIRPTTRAVETATPFEAGAPGITK